MLVENAIVMVVGTIIFALLGSIGCCCFGKNAVVWRTAICGTAFAFWILWICTYMAQMNPQLIPSRPDFWIEQHK